MLKNKKFIIAGLILVITIISFLSLQKALGFHFWRDDWGNLWELKFHPEVSIHFDNSVSLRRHPGLAIEKVVGNYFFKDKILLWQLFGIILRILDSLAVGLMVFGLTKSKKAGVLTGLFMASAIGGLESVTWISAHTSALLIFFLSIGVYFWAKSQEESISKNKLFILALLFLSTGVLVTPAAGMIILPMVVLWEVLTYLRFRDLLHFKLIVTRIGLGVIVILSAVSLLNSKLKMFSSGDIFNTFKAVLSNTSLVKNYFSSLGNLLTSWFYPTSEPISLSSQTNFNLSIGLGFALISVLLVIVFLFKRTRSLQVAVFFSVWLFLFYLPNWMYEKTLVVGSSHRYLTDSSVALVSLMAIILYKFKPKLSILLAVVFIALNINSSNKVLESITQYRSYNIVEPIWEKINNDVQPNQKDLIFMYFGSDLVWGTSMSWSGSVPFGIKRGIKNTYDLPIITGDPALVSNLICKANVSRPSFGGWETQRSPIPISHLYAWVWENGVLTDISEKERENIRKLNRCKL